MSCALLPVRSAFLWRAKSHPILSAGELKKGSAPISGDGLDKFQVRSNELVPNARDEHIDRPFSSKRTGKLSNYQQVRWFAKAPSRPVRISDRDLEFDHNEPGSVFVQLCAAANYGQLWVFAQRYGHDHFSLFSGGYDHRSHCGNLS